MTEPNDADLLRDIKKRKLIVYENFPALRFVRRVIKQHAE
jgi:hypothetical protein